MRDKIADQLAVAPPRIDHSHAAELVAIGAILDELPEAAELVLRDLVPEGVDARRGRPGMSASQVLRILVVKQMRGFSYDELAFHLGDSTSYRAFCRLPAFGPTPKKSALQANLKKIRAATVERINQALVRFAIAEGAEDASRVRIDSTVVETDIHHPTDSSLLVDSVKVLTRIMKSAKEAFGVSCCDHTKRAKKRGVDIFYATKKADRIEPYRELVKVTKKTMACASQAADELKAAVKAADDILSEALATTLVTRLEHYIGLAEKVIDQTQRRLFQGETVPAAEKIVSIHEPHTDIIRKDNKNTYYGHKITLSAGSRLFFDCVVEEGNPADSTMTVPMIDRHIEVCGQPPREVVYDGGFASQENLDQIKAKNVDNVVFTKGRGVSIEDMVKEPGLFAVLRDFRAGVEGCISLLKRCFGLRRCLWSGFESFTAYVWSSVLSSNLLRFARLRLG